MGASGILFIQITNNRKTTPNKTADPDFLEKMVAAVGASLMLIEPFRSGRALSMSLSPNLFYFIC